MSRKEQFSDLLFEYAVCKRYVNREANKRTESTEKTLLNSMARDLGEAMEYMETGIDPWNYKSEASAPKRRITLIADEHLLSVLKSQQAPIEEELEANTFDEALLNDLLKNLSAREKECYLLIKQSLFSYNATADLLNISVGAVERFVIRATAKIEKNKQNNPFVELKEW
ncbi:hypothetical protein ACJYYY_02145 [Brochothrix campestris]|uniref:hypothetical protein n=1 Tax=Brochothrix campestris TaxID=2757 RepID=UPI0038D09B01